MNDEGVFTVYRGVFKHPIFDGEEYSRRDAWLWLVGNAVWKPTRVRIVGSIIPLERGQLAYSERFMAKAWGWSKSRVHRFLLELQAENMLIVGCSKIGPHDDQKSDHETNRLTICNYDNYQFAGTSNRTTNEPASGPRADQQRTKEEELNKERIDIVRSEATDESPIALIPKTKRSTGIDPSFIEFYSAYPRRQSKQDAIKAYSAVLKTGVTHETIMRGLEAAKRVDRRFRDPQFTPLPASWLRAGGFEDEAGSTPQQDWKRAVFS